MESAEHIVNAFQARVAANWPRARWQGLRVLVAVSGGPDSVALLRALHALAPSPAAEMLLVAHCNHHLRGAQSDEDAQFVGELGIALGLTVLVGDVDVSTQERLAGDGLEAAARAARYEFLTKVAEEQGARYLALGHTADDQAETVLHRVLRGTGLAGLRGMPRTRRLTPAVTLVRPFLDLWRSDVMAYLAALGQAYRTDATNLDYRLTRNRIRHDLLPKLEAEYNPGVRAALVRLGGLAREAEEALRPFVEHLVAAAVRQRTEEEAELDAALLAEQPVYLVRELLRAVWTRAQWPEQSMGYAEWEALWQMLCGEGTPRDFPGGIRAERRGARLVLRRRTGEPES